MSFQARRLNFPTLLGVAFLSTACTLSAFAQTAQKPVVSSQLRKAKTILVKETFSLGGRDGKFTPYFAVTTEIERPGTYRIQAEALIKQKDKVTPPSFLLVNKSDQYEFNGFSNTYTRTAAPKAGERASSELYSMAGLEAILHPGEAPSSRAKITRTTSNEKLDGKAMFVTTDSEPERKGRDGSVVKPFTRLWVDAKTGLPYRKVDGALVNGKESINLKLDYNEFVFNKPIPSKQFAWAAPAGSKEYVPLLLLTAGTPAPDFEATTPEGKTVHLSDYKGKVVVLDFWATWCGPCQQSMPHLEKVYQQIKDKDVVVLAVCVWDEKSAYDKWVVEKKSTYTFQTVFDPAGRGPKNIAGNLYHVSGIPTQYVIGKDGKVASSTVGYSEGVFPLEASLAKLGIDIKVPDAKTASAK